MRRTGQGVSTLGAIAAGVFTLRLLAGADDRMSGTAMALGFSLVARVCNLEAGAGQ